MRHVLAAGSRGILAATAVLLFAVLGGCKPPDPEQRLRATVDALGAAVEARDAPAIGQLLADDFIGPGGLDRQGARRLAALRFMRHDQVGVVRGPLHVRMQGDHATVRFQAVLTGGGSALPEAAARYDVETGWRLSGGEWRLTSASW